jgi:transcriptional regulator with XRE-family HTH domain
MMNIEQFIRRREALGLTTAGLAREIGVAASTVWRWERGRRISPLAQLQVDATFFRLERQRFGTTSEGTPVQTPA